MEKASEVYNKLKLRFMGKSEVAAKPQTEGKEAEEDDDDEKETTNTGKKSHLGSCFYHVWYYLYFVCDSYFNLRSHFLDSTPVNGESQPKKDDMELEENPKSPAHEENNDDATSSPNR